jgi:hypothetical protein
MAQVRIEAFIKDIQENLYRGAEFVKQSVSHDQYVDDYAVHVPQAGNNVTVIKNRLILPATVVERNDDQVIYNLDEYTTDPILIRNIEKIQLSYDKRMSVMKNKIQLINQQIGDDAAYNWAAGLYVPTTVDGVYQTTGTLTALSNAIYPTLFQNGATGSRRLTQLLDILQLKNKMDRDNVPQDGRFILFPSDMWADLINTNITILGSRLYLPDDEMVKDGAVAKIFGFNIFQRPTVNVFVGGANPTLKAVGAAGAATDTLGALAWQQDCVAKAQGAIKFFAREDDPAYYGSYYSALVMFHNVALRKDAKGIAALTLANS